MNKLRTEQLGDIELATDYWDCECDTNYIHPVSFIECALCGARRDDAPLARASEARDALARGEL